MATEDVRAALETARRKLRKPQVKDPPPNCPMTIAGEPVKPGEWRGDLFGLPPACPVEVLGKDGRKVYLVDTLGQMIDIDDSGFGQNFIAGLFGDRQWYLYWAWPRRNKDGAVVGWAAEKVRETLHFAAARRGLFSPDNRVRGRGGWLDDKAKAFVWHSGDLLWRSNARKKRKDGSAELVPEPAGRYCGDQFYPARPSILAPWPEEVTSRNNPAVEIYAALKRWNWERPEIDPFLFLGWLAAAFYGGALEWRPMAFVTGDKGQGKSQLQKLTKAVLGDALLQAADTTAAGIYQTVRQDSLPVAVDEMEAEEDARRTRAIIRLAQLASSGAKMRRGGTEHDPVEFEARNCFFFSGINPPAMEPAQRSRMGMLRLKPLEVAKSAKAPPVVDAETTGPRLLRRMLDRFGELDAVYQSYRTALRQAGHDGRAQDTLASLLACADLALGEEGMFDGGLPQRDEAEAWGRLIPAEESEANWLACLRHLLTSRVEAWRSGTRATVGQLLDELRDGEANFPEASRQLAATGLGLIEPGKRDGTLLADGALLCVPENSPLVMALYKGTKWEGLPGASVWQHALRQAPAELLYAGDNRVRIAGARVRCTIVKLGAFERGEW